MQHRIEIKRVKQLYEENECLTNRVCFLVNENEYLKYLNKELVNEIEVLKKKITMFASKEWDEDMFKKVSEAFRNNKI